jgi:hypothetical protein
MRRCVAGSGRVSGSRSPSPASPRIESAALSGIGFASQKSASITGRSAACSPLASSRRPARAASTSALISAGSAFASTETSPSAPTAIAGSARLSSPESTVLPSGSWRTTSAICATLPLDSFTATTSSISHRSASAAGVRLSPVRPGTL